MSVPKSKRNESSVAFEAVYIKVYKDACNLIKHHFGANPQSYQENFLIIDSAEKQVMLLVKKLLYRIRIANSIYPTCKAELDERRINQDKAIGICYTLLTEYQLVMITTEVPEEKYVEYIKNIEHEINSLKKWRQSDNKFKNKLK